MSIPKFIYEMAERLRTQDNLATSQPLYCVLQPEKVHGVDCDYSDTYEWHDTDSGEWEEATPEEAVKLEALDEEGEDTRIDGNLYERVYHVVKERFITASLTRAGAEEHLRLNGHNIRGAYIYVTSLYRTPDMIALREWLMSLTEQPSTTSDAGAGKVGRDHD